MKIEVGKRYRDRQGEIVRIVADDAPGCQPMVGVRERLSGQFASVTTFDETGSCFGPEEATKFDLLDEVREPREVWVLFEEDPEDAPQRKVKQIFQVKPGPGHYAYDRFIKFREVIE